MLTCSCMSKSSLFKLYNASAGSGKTFNLVKEYLVLLLNSEDIFFVRNILSITFTNKAVKEKKRRILDYLADFLKRKINGMVNPAICNELMLLSKNITSILQNISNIITNTGNENKVRTNWKNNEEEIKVSEDEIGCIGMSLIQKATDTTKIRVSWESMKTPDQIFEYDIEKKSKKLVKETQIPSGHDPKKYVVERLMAKSHDGANVPISLVRRKDTKLDGKNKLVLYFYHLLKSFALDHLEAGI